MLYAGSGWEIFWEERPGTNDSPPGGLGLNAYPRALYDVDTPGFLSGPSREIEITELVPGDEAHATRRARSDARAVQIIIKHNFVQWIEAREQGEWRRVCERFRWSDLLHLRWQGNRWVAGPMCRISRGHHSIHSPW